MFQNPLRPPSAPSFTPVIPGTPTLSKGPQELLEDEKFIDQQLACFAVEQRKLELRFQSYRDRKIEFIRKRALDDTMKPNDQIKHAAMIAAADPKVQDEGDGHISLKSYANMLKSAMVHLPTLIKEQLDANHIQEWSEGMPKWEEKKERDGERSEGWNKEEIAQWTQNIKITKKARCIS